MEEYKQNITRMEIERGIYQIMHAHAVCDLRSVITVRRASQVVPPQHHDQKDLTSETSWFNVWAQTDERTDSDDEDEGGEEGLNKVVERSYLRMKRSFELLLNTGRVVRFEVRDYCRGFFSASSWTLIGRLFRLILAAWLVNG